MKGKNTTRMMICSMGEVQESTVQSLKAVEPESVVFYCSHGASEYLPGVIRECPFIRHTAVVETTDGEDIEANLHLLYMELPVHVDRRGLSWENVLVDYTGGTKAMGAALVLATVDTGVQYAYVSGDKQNGGGKGIVVDGTEKVLRKSNPWNSIVLKQRRGITNAWKFGHYGEAARLCQEIKDNVSGENYWKDICGGLIPMFEAYEEWDRFRYKQAFKLMRQARGMLHPFCFMSRPVKAVIVLMENHIRLLEPMAVGNAEKKRGFLLQDLLANAVRRGAEGRYDDAAARLNRVLELAAQHRLWEGYNIDSKKCDKKKVPETFRQKYVQRDYSDDELLQLGLHTSYILLEELGDEMGRKYGRRQEEIQQLLLLRNQSVLAHGLDPVTENDYDRMLRLVLELTQTKKTKLPIFSPVDLATEL
ncbi:MAG: TIGR02710 family CRISPR-associated protein [Alkalicoccus sp.]|nr:MAG: TIGR02710 family CRISPR-associated protein [Alkalicoccus sp.]